MYINECTRETVLRLRWVAVVQATFQTKIRKIRCDFKIAMLPYADGDAGKYDI